MCQPSPWKEPDWYQKLPPLWSWLDSSSLNCIVVVSWAGFFPTTGNLSHRYEVCSISHMDRFPWPIAVTISRKFLEQICDSWGDVRAIRVCVFLLHDHCVFCLLYCMLRHFWFRASVAVGIHVHVRPAWRKAVTGLGDKPPLSPRVIGAMQEKCRIVPEKALTCSTCSSYKQSEKNYSSFPCII